HVYVIQVTQDLVVGICVVVAPAQGRVEGAPDLVVEDDDFDLVRGGVCDQPVGHHPALALVVLVHGPIEDVEGAPFVVGRSIVVILTSREQHGGMQVLFVVEVGVIGRAAR